MNTLQDDYKDICFRYLCKFNQKHELDLDAYELHNCWVGGEVGGIADLNEMFLNFDDIRYDIDNNILGDKIFDWYWNSVERAEMKIKYMNFESYCKGAPDPVPEQELVRIKMLQKKLQDVYGEFMDSIEQYKEKDSSIFGIDDIKESF